MSVVLLVLIGSALVIGQPWSWCPANWTGASRIGLNNSFGDVVLDGKPYRVGASAALDYMPRDVFTPLDRVSYSLRGDRHPLSVTASISASSREALGDPVFTCFRVTRGSEQWERRPTTYGTQTLADGYPPGAQLPARNDAWRLASADDGPEWPDGELIGLELWMTVDGRRYVFVLQPFVLMKGG